MTITKLSTKYKIEDKGTWGNKKLKIIAFALADGTINILNQAGEKEFTFQNSTPAMISKIANMLRVASKLRL
jgi:hypothetical protein